MFLKLLKRYLKSFENPWLKALTSTFISFLLCVLPFLLVLIGEWILHLIQEWLLIPHFEFAFIEWLLRGVKWFIENLSLLAVPVLLLLSGAFILRFYLKRYSIKVMVAVYVFKRMTEPLLVVNFAAWLVSFLINYKPFYFLDHLINDKDLQTIGSGQMVLAMLGMWLLLTLAFHIQLSKIREENSAVGVLAIMEKTRLELLNWIEKHQRNRSVILNKSDD